MTLQLMWRNVRATALNATLQLLVINRYRYRLLLLLLYMTYKLELFLVLQKKAHKYKIIQKLYFLWFTYIGLIVFFYTKLTHLTQKLKKKKKKIRWDTCHKVKLKLKSNFYIKLTHLTL